MISDSPARTAGSGRKICSCSNVPLCCDRDRGEVVGLGARIPGVAAVMDWRATNGGAGRDRPLKRLVLENRVEPVRGDWLSFTMRDEERLALFAEFLGLPVSKLRQHAIERGLVSRSTFDRIRRGTPQGPGARQDAFVSEAGQVHRPRLPRGADAPQRSVRSLRGGSPAARGGLVRVRPLGCLPERRDGRTSGVEQHRGTLAHKLRRHCAVHRKAAPSRLASSM
jgi:hypothetical protein